MVETLYVKHLLKELASNSRLTGFKFSTKASHVHVNLRHLKGKKVVATVVQTNRCKNSLSPPTGKEGYSCYNFSRCCRCRFFFLKADVFLRFYIFHKHLLTTIK